MGKNVLYQLNVRFVDKPILFRGKIYWPYLKYRVIKQLKTVSYIRDEVNTTG